MPKKKSVKKKTSKKKAKTTKKPRVSAQQVEIKMQPILVDNFVALQKVMITLSSKFDNLQTQLSKLVDLFELSAKSLAKKDFKLEQGQDNHQVLDKLTTLTEQNKLIARGLTLVHESNQQPPLPTPEPRLPPAPILQQQAPTLQQQAPPMPKPKTEDEYQKSAPSLTPLKPKELPKK